MSERQNAPATVSIGQEVLDPFIPDHFTLLGSLVACHEHQRNISLQINSHVYTWYPSRLLVNIIGDKRVCNCMTLAVGLSPSSPSRLKRVSRRIRDTWFKPSMHSDTSLETERHGSVQWGQCCAVGTVLCSGDSAAQWWQCCAVGTVLRSGDSAVQWGQCCAVQLWHYRTTYPARLMRMCWW